jgi:membrane protease subunit (stomatin/prohibitin family)
VWIGDGDLYERARQLIERFERRETGGERWTCARCGEPNEPAFEFCWNCGTDPRRRPDQSPGKV